MGVTTSRLPRRLPSNFNWSSCGEAGDGRQVPPFPAVLVPTFANVFPALGKISSFCAPPRAATGDGPSARRCHAPSRRRNSSAGMGVGGGGGGHDLDVRDARHLLYLVDDVYAELLAFLLLVGSTFDALDSRIGMWTPWTLERIQRAVRAMPATERRQDEAFSSMPRSADLFMYSRTSARRAIWLGTNWGACLDLLPPACMDGNRMRCRRG